MTYPEQCLERANNATEGPWVKGKNEMGRFGNKLRVEINGPDYLNVAEFTKQDAEFIAHARTDVPELARRLKKACKQLRNECLRPASCAGYGDCSNCKLADELEAPLEKV